MEYWLAVLVIVVLALVREILRSRKQPRTSVSRPADLGRVAELEKDAAGRLKRIGREWLMLEDYHFRTRLSSPASIPLSEVERQLQSALVEILSHLHLLPNVKLIVTDDPEKLAGGKHMGEYSHGFFQKSIRMLVRPEYSSSDLLNVLCHEATHYFMYSLGVNDPDPDRNEGLTEVTSCLIGFSEAMMVSNINRDPPYLNQPEFRQVRTLLLARREVLRREKVRTEDLEGARRQLRKNLSGARTMLEQARAMIAGNPAPRDRKMSRASLALLQQAMLALETGAYTETLRQAEASLTGSAAEVREADRKVLALCGDVVRIMAAFS